MSLYQDNGIWYVSLIHPETGRRIRKTTRTRDKEEALTLERAMIEDINASRTGYSLDHLIELYSSPTTNPRMKSYKITGQSYSEDYAERVADHVKDIRSILKRKAPRLLKMNIRSIQTIHIKTVRDIIFEEYGACRKAQYIFRSFRSMFGEAVAQGWTEYNPTLGIHDISYEEKEEIYIPSFVMRQLIDDRERYPDVRKWAYCALIAVTGLRKMEALAITAEKIKDGCLLIDSQVTRIGDTTKDPKWHVIRRIVLPKVALKILSYITPDEENGRYFPHNRNWVPSAINAVKNIETALHPEQSQYWKAWHLHGCRHFLNTNLRAMGIPDSLSQEWLAWKHEGDKKIQRRYTHFVPEHLQAVADAIDKLYLYEEALEKSQ